MKTFRIKTRLHHRINKAGEQSIIIRVTFNKCRVDLETGLTIAASKWDDKLCEAKRNVVNGQGYTFREMNDSISNKISTINAIFKKYDLTNKYPTATQLKDEYKEALGHLGQHHKTLLAYYDEFIENRATLNSWSANTKKKYNAIRAKLTAFDPSLKIEDLDNSRLTALVAFFQRYWKQNTTFTKRWQDIGAFFKWCRDNNYPIHQDCAGFKIKLKLPKRTIIYLERDELLKVYNYKFSKQLKYLDLYRDWFCLSAFTSLRFSDVMKLRKVDVRDTYIEITTQKDSDAVKIDLNKYSKEIIKKYKKNPFAKEFVLPRVHNAVLNRYLKEIGKICEIDTPITKISFEGATRKEETKPKYEYITSHTGRKTFICLALSMGIPPTTVMAWTGHDSFEDMKPYIRITDEAKAREMAKFDTLATRELETLEEQEQD